MTIVSDPSNDDDDALSDDELKRYGLGPYAKALPKRRTLSRAQGPDVGNTYCCGSCPAKFSKYVAAERHVDDMHEGGMIYLELGERNDSPTEWPERVGKDRRPAKRLDAPAGRKRRSGQVARRDS